MPIKNAFYAQSGGPTAVINATASSLIKTARASNKIGTVYAGKNGILGALNEELIDTSHESDAALDLLQYTPGSAFGSCRYQLKNINNEQSEYEQLVKVFQAHNIGYFFYNGGGDSQDTAYKISQISSSMGYPLTCIGLPKTIDNDLALTDNSPGFGSAAKYVATSLYEAALDLKSMSASSTQVFILEVMGRHAGWLAAATGLAQSPTNPAPHIILFPEVTFNQEQFLNQVKNTVAQQGYCVIAASEGIKDSQGQFLSESGEKDAFGHHQLGGLAPKLSHMINRELHLKNHWAVADYLQRSARHIASQTDHEQAIAIGKAAIDFALAGKNNIMLTIERQATADYQWTIGTAPLAEVANNEKLMPLNFISEDGFGITQHCRDYMIPLIQGESFPPFSKGIPQYHQLDNKLVKKKVVNNDNTIEMTLTNE